MAIDAELGVTRLVWLNDGASSASAEWVKLEVVKLAYREGLRAHRLDLIATPPERLRQLATLARRSTPRALRQMTPQRGHPILLAVLAAAHTEIVDEIVHLFDMVLANTDGNARDQMAEGQADTVRSDVGRLALLDAILDVVSDSALDAAAVVLLTTGYLEDAVDAEQAAGHDVSDEAKTHLSFSHFEALNPYGTMVFDITGVLKRSRRPLRRP